MSLFKTAPGFHSTKQTLNTNDSINLLKCFFQFCIYTLKKYWGNICHGELGDVGNIWLKCQQTPEGLLGGGPPQATRLFAVIPWGGWGCFEEAREEKCSGADD